MNWAVNGDSLNHTARASPGIYLVPGRAIPRTIGTGLHGEHESVRCYVRSSPEHTCHFTCVTANGVSRIIEYLTYIKAQPLRAVVKGGQAEHEITLVLAVIFPQGPDQSTMQNAL